MPLWIASLIGAFALTLAPAFSQTHTFDSNPLGSQFAVGNWRQVRLTINPARQTGGLILFSNRFVCCMGWLFAHAALDASDSRRALPPRC